MLPPELYNNISIGIGIIKVALHHRSFEMAHNCYYYIYFDVRFFSVTTKACIILFSWVGILSNILIHTNRQKDAYKCRRIINIDWGHHKLQRRDLNLNKPVAKISSILDTTMNSYGNPCFQKIRSARDACNTPICR